MSTGYSQTPSYKVAAIFLFMAVLSIAAPFSENLQTGLTAGVSIFLIAILFDGIVLYLKPAHGVVKKQSATLKLHRMKEARFTFEAKQNAAAPASITHYTIPFPEGFDQRHETFKARSKNPLEWHTFQAQALPLKRGTKKIERIYASGSSWLGLWNFRTAIEVDWNFHIYSNLQAEDKSIAAFLMRRDLSGLSARRLLGLGREFDRLRDYQPGDPYANISWKASARKNRPITEVKQIERMQQVYALIDASSLSKRTVDQTFGKDKTVSSPLEILDRYINGALALALSANNQGDNFGAIAYSRYPSLFLKANAGTAHYSALQNALKDLQCDNNHPNYEELFAQVRTKIRSRSLLVVFTNFENASILDSFLKAAKLVSKQHVILAVSIIPESTVPLFKNPDLVDSRELYSRLAGHINWSRLMEAERRLSSMGIKLLLTQQESLCAQVVSRYVTIKERQLV